MTCHPVHTLLAEDNPAMSDCDRNSWQKMIDMEKDLEALRKDVKAPVEDQLTSH